MNTSLETSQIWKDLQRDRVSINGELVSGQNRGAESIIAALTRHIMLAAQTTRRFTLSPTTDSGPPTVPSGGVGLVGMVSGVGVPQVPSFTPSFLPSNTTTPRVETRKTLQPSSLIRNISPSKVDSTTHTSNLRDISMNYFHRLTRRSSSQSGVEADMHGDSNCFAIRESHALACAKEVLVLCNRTQSGGDTYFCIQSFLAKCGIDAKVQDHACVLTPLETESEPLEIFVHVGYHSPGSGVTVIADDPTGAYLPDSPTSTANLSSVRATIKRSQSEGGPKLKAAISGVSRTTFKPQLQPMDPSPSQSMSSDMYKQLRSQQVLEDDSEPPTAGANPDDRLKSDTIYSADTTTADSHGSGLILTPSTSWVHKLKPYTSSPLLHGGNNSPTSKPTGVPAGSLTCSPISSFGDPRAPKGATQGGGSTTPTQKHSLDSPRDTRVSSPTSTVRNVEDDDIFERVDVQSDEESDDERERHGDDGDTGTLLEVEDDDFSIVSELLVDRTSEGCQRTDLDGDDDDDISRDPSHEGPDSAIFVPADQSEKRHRSTSSSPSQGRSQKSAGYSLSLPPASATASSEKKVEFAKGLDESQRRRTSSGNQRGFLHPFQSGGMRVPDAIRPKSRSVHDVDTLAPLPSSLATTSAGEDNVMEYEVRPKQSGYIFKATSFKLFDHPLGSGPHTHHSLPFYGASSSHPTQANMNTGRRPSEANTTPIHGGETLHRKKSSLSGIYEQQLSSLVAAKVPELVIRIVVKVCTIYIHIHFVYKYIF